MFGQCQEQGSVISNPVKRCCVELEIYNSKKTIAAILLMAAVLMILIAIYAFLPGGSS